MVFGLITIILVFWLRHQVDPNAGIFAVFAKLGVGSVGRARSDHTNPTVYIEYPQTFDLVWILNTLVVFTVASSLL